MGPWSSLHFLFLQSVFSVFRLNSFYLRFSSSPRLFSVPSILLLSLSIELLFWLLYFISSKISVWFLCLFTETIFSFVPSVFLIACWSIFTMALLKLCQIILISHLVLGIYQLTFSFQVEIFLFDKQYLVETWTFWVLQYETLDLIHGPRKLPLYYSASYLSLCLSWLLLILLQ